MASYRIENRTSGLILGTYEGTSEGDVLDALARDAGYADYAHLQQEVPGSLIVTEIKKAS